MGDIVTYTEYVGMTIMWPFLRRLSSGLVLLLVPLLILFLSLILRVFKRRI